MPKPSGPQSPRERKHLYLQRASDKLVCHCNCDDAWITFPPQMDCPWCGCGWLFCCSKCRKAFAFAKCVEINESWEETALRDLNSRGPDFEKPTADDVEAWVAAMKVMCEELEPGQEYVYLDGWFIPTDIEEISMEGMHAYHELNCVPQVEALNDPDVIKELLGNEDYWTENQVPDDDEHDHDDEYEEDGESAEDEEDEEDEDKE
jgi:hypothetical protein